MRRGPLRSGQKQPFTVDTMMKLARISEPVLSPDGTQVAFTVQTVDLDKNAKPSQVYTVPVQGGAPRQLTTEGTTNERPRWSPDSKVIYFVSNRGGSSQVWAMNADGSNAHQVTKFAAEAGGILVSPDGKKIVFLSSVYPDCGADDDCNQRKIDEESKKQGQGSHLYHAAVPSLEPVEGRAPPAPDGGQCGWHGP